jgi:hypothetical protein
MNNAQHGQTIRVALRAMRSVLLMGIFSAGAFYFNRCGFYPHGSPLIYAIAMSWLIAITAAVPVSVIFVFQVDP